MIKAKNFCQNTPEKRREKRKEKKKKKSHTFMSRQKQEFIYYYSSIKHNLDNYLSFLLFQNLFQFGKKTLIKKGKIVYIVILNKCYHIKLFNCSPFSFKFNKTLTDLLERYFTNVN